MDAQLVRKIAELERKLEAMAMPEKSAFNEIVNANQFATAQAAIDFAEVNGYKHVYFPEGTYGNILISVAGLTIEGASASTVIFQDTSSHCVEVDAANVTLKNFRVTGTDGGGETRDAIHINNGLFGTFIRGIQFQSSDRYGLYSDAGWSTMTGCNFTASANFDSNKVFLDTNSDDCVIVGNTNIDADTTDNGAGNVIANNS
jgi:hypothetical protein